MIAHGIFAEPTAKGKTEEDRKIIRQKEKDRKRIQRYVIIMYLQKSMLVHTIF